MKKELFGSVICLMGLPVLALDCAYAPQQEIVRSAENYKEIAELGESFDANANYPCGGTLSQLAVLRGNLDTLDYLYAHGANFNKNVSLKGYEIPGAPSVVPFPLFVARYAPNSAIVDTMINSGVDFRVKDSLGHDVFWYFEQNPVLRNSYLTKKGYEGILPLHERIRLEREKILREQAAAAEAAGNQ